MIAEFRPKRWGLTFWPPLCIIRRSEPYNNSLSSPSTLRLCTSNSTAYFPKKRLNRTSHSIEWLPLNNPPTEVFGSAPEPVYHSLLIRYFAIGNPLGQCAVGLDKGFVVIKDSEECVWGEGAAHQNYLD